MISSNYLGYRSIVSFQASVLIHVAGKQQLVGNDLEPFHLARSRMADFRKAPPVQRMVIACTDTQLARKPGSGPARKRAQSQNTGLGMTGAVLY